jgi:hypothetical protein
LDVVKDLLSPRYLENDIWLRMWNTLADPVTLKLAMDKANWSGELEEADITDDDLQKLLAYNYIERQPDGVEIEGTVRLRTTMEKENTRRRLLCVPDLLNEIFTETGLCDMCTVEQIQEDLPLEGAVCMDYAAQYTQLALPIEARVFYCFKYHGEVFRICTVPTGARGCPAVAHAICTSLAERSVEISMTNVVPRGYLDNVRFAGKKDDVETVVRCQLTLASRIGGMIELQNSFSPEYDFLGVHCNHATMTTQPCQKLRNKIDDRYRTIVQRQPTVRDGMRFLGLMVWVSRVGWLPMQHFYPVLKFLRRRASADPEDPLNLWPGIRNNLEQMFQVAQQRVPRELSKRREETETYVLFTDASTYGWGATFFGFDRIVEVFYGPWPTHLKDRQIDELEMLAILNALTSMKSAGFQVQNGSLLLAIDNTSILHSVSDENKIHKKWGINSGCVQMRQKMILLGFIYLKVQWVPSLRNLADAPSRFFQEYNSMDVL